ncbi:hypothetical protein Sango_3021300 [Sesamum angolense]|uniref:Uncharacterized protein n=1 Tax=Sesamum angolense TaxID=2727404 RepID=A0AAE1T2M7_9LAMI|nr:hypothetical protein Sango_3021300 [Sesamum angolense]
MLYCLCGPHQFLCVSFLRAYSPGGILNVSYNTTWIDTHNSYYPSFMARTTRVSNPIRSSSFRLSVSVSAEQSAFVIGVLSNLYAFHCSTKNSLCPYRTQAL